MSGSAAHVRLLLVEDVAQVSQYIRNLLHAQDQVQLLDVLTEGRQALDQVAQLRPDVLMIDSLLQGKLSGMQLLERVRAAGVDLPVILITVPQRPVKVTPEMGIVRILSMPFSGYDFMTAVQSAKQEHLALSPDATSRTFVVYGPKGGVGKTTLAFNLAVSMAQLPNLRVGAGRRQPPVRGCPRAAARARFGAFRAPAADRPGLGDGPGAGRLA